MKTINIAGAIEKLMIFGDPELCQRQGGFCRFLDLRLTKPCILFDSHLELHNKWWLKKCDACKAAYRKVKINPDDKKIADEIGKLFNPLF